MDKARQYLGIGRKAGLLVTGEDMCASAVGSGKAKLLLLAGDASPNAKKRAEGFLYGHRALLQTLPWSKEELSALLGRRGCSMVCFTDLPLAARFAAARAAASVSGSRSVSAGAPASVCSTISAACPPPA